MLDIPDHSGMLILLYSCGLVTKFRLQTNRTKSLPRIAYYTRKNKITQHVRMHRMCLRVYIHKCYLQIMNLKLLKTVYCTRIIHIQGTIIYMECKFHQPELAK